LDVGCGDGHFVTVAFDRKIDVGIDPWATPIREAAQRGGYNLLSLADGACMPFASASFGSAFSNSVLEHIPNVQEVLVDVGRVLKPGAPFVFCGPNDHFLQGLSVSNFLDRAGLRSLGDSYRGFFNRIARHVHCDSPEVWQKRLDQAGFTLERWWHYYPPEAMYVTEWGHYLGLPSLVYKRTVGRWILVPAAWNLWLTDRLVRRHYQPQADPNGVCTFYIARRKSI
jgi:SAM-dependent methyltransferase